MAKKSKLEERMGSDEFNRLAASGMQDSTNKNKYSAKEVMAEFRGRGDLKVDEGDDNIKQRFLDAQAGGAKFNQRAQNYLTEQHGFDFSKKGTGKDVTPEKQEEAQAFKDDKVKKVINTMNKKGGGATEAIAPDENIAGAGGIVQSASFDRVFGDNQNTMGSGNVIHGNVNQGNQDYSFNQFRGRVY